MVFLFWNIVMMVNLDFCLSLRTIALHAHDTKYNKSIDHSLTHNMLNCLCFQCVAAIIMHVHEQKFCLNLKIITLHACNAEYDTRY